MLPYPDHPSKFGYKDGDPIRAENVYCILIYCGQDRFQNEFSKTYRAQEQKETFASIKKRHSEYHHFGRILKEMALLKECSTELLVK